MWCKFVCMHIETHTKKTHLSGYVCGPKDAGSIDCVYDCEQKNTMCIEVQRMSVMNNFQMWDKVVHINSKYYEYK